MHWFGEVIFSCRAKKKPQPTSFQLFLNPLRAHPESWYSFLQVHTRVVKCIELPWSIGYIIQNLFISLIYNDALYNGSSLRKVDIRNHVLFWPDSVLVSFIFSTTFWPLATKDTTHNGCGCELHWRSISSWRNEAVTRIFTSELCFAWI